MQDRSRPWNIVIAGFVLLVPLLALLVTKLLVPKASVMEDNVLGVISLVVTPVLALLGGIVLGWRLGKSAISRLLLILIFPFVLLVCGEMFLYLGCSIRS